MISNATEVADVLFHAAMALGSGRKSVVKSAVADAVKYLHWTDDVKIWRPFHDTMRLYTLVNSHSGDAWPLCGGFHHAGRWLSLDHKHEQLMSVLLTYEYAVQELGGKRSLADPNYLIVNFDASLLTIEYS